MGEVVSINGAPIWSRPSSGSFPSEGVNVLCYWKESDSHAVLKYEECMWLDDYGFDYPEPDGWQRLTKPK